jgi:formylglycine-generating enzyme required for sulfatase activity
MRKMKNVICLAALCVMAAVNFASADTIREINMDFVTIGNAGNAGDTRTGTDYTGNPIANPYGCGTVSYNYRIGKYEVTAAQWQTINTAAGIGDTGYWTGNQPVASISWYDAAQFCNYLTSGNKYSGAYKFDINGNFQEIDRVSSISTYGTTYVIPTENEWYKAAYYTGSGYSSYANGLNTIPAADNGWNYDGGAYSSPWAVGTGTMEQNDTFDMMGNVWEWNESSIYDYVRGRRGGAYPNYDGYLASSGRNSAEPDYEGDGVGFRVASLAPVGPLCPSADLTDDCVVDFNDIAVLVAEWLNVCNVSNGWCGGTDFTQDGTVNLSDFAVLAGQWLQGS